VNARGCFLFGEHMSGTITSLVVQEKNKERVNVFLDGEFAFGLAMLEALKLRKGQLLSDVEIARLKALDEIEVAHERALNFLSYRPRSVAEVRRNLVDKGFSEEAIDIVTARLVEARLLGDEAFARYWVDNREAFGPRSARALRFELRKKGVPDADIASAVEEVDEDSAAYRSAQSVAKRHANADWQTFRKKVGDFLLRRGFQYGTAKDVIKRLWEESGDRRNSGDDYSDNE
jgi:regulatory protein